MLPGFRFLFAATMLSMSVLIFGLGAAALLRAAHEEFASNPSWHAARETTFTQQGEATRPVLALLRVDTPVVEKPSDDVPAAAAPAAITSAPDEPERTAALNSEVSSLPEPAKPEIPAVESPAPSEAAPAPADAPASADETKIAATEEASLPATETARAAEAAPASPAQTSAAAWPDTVVAATKIATLGGPPITIEAQPGKAAGAKPDESVIKKRLQARRAAQRRRMAARARLAAQQALHLQQQALSPFAQPATR